MSSPGAMRATQPDLGANQEGSPGNTYLSVRTLSREARKVVDELDLPVSGSRMRDLIRRFVSEGRGDIDFRTWVIAYADPTGETAVRNVMRGGPRG
jgi:hypothetical protein